MLPSGPTVRPSTLDGCPGVASGSTASTSTSPRSNAPAGGVAVIRPSKTAAHQIILIISSPVLTQDFFNPGFPERTLNPTRLRRDDFTNVKFLQLQVALRARDRPICRVQWSTRLERVINLKT